MHADEFFSFTTPNKGFQFPAHSKMILVTVQERPEGQRIIGVVSIAASSIKMLENSGVSHIPAEELPQHVRHAIDTFAADHIRQTLNRAWDRMGLNSPPAVKTIQ